MTQTVLHDCERRSSTHLHSQICQVAARDCKTIVIVFTIIAVIVLESVEWILAVRREVFNIGVLVERTFEMRDGGQDHTLPAAS